MATGIANPNWKPGKPRKICGANKPHGGVCGLAAGYRTDHPGYGACVHHLGRTAAVTLGANRQLARDLGNSFITEDSPDVDPITALLGEVSRTAGHVAWLGQKIGLWTMDVQEEIPIYQQQWLQVYNTERTHLSRVSEAAIKAGVAQRQVAIAEQQGGMLADAISSILDALNLSIEQRNLVPEVVPRVLYAIATRIDAPATA